MCTFPLIQQIPFCLLLSLNCTMNVYKTCQYGVFCVIVCQVAAYWGLAAASIKNLLPHLISSWFGISKFLIRIALILHFNMATSKTSFSKGYGNRLNNYRSPGHLKHICKLLSPSPRVFLLWKGLILCHRSRNPPVLLELAFIFFFLYSTGGTPSKSLDHVFLSLFFFKSLFYLPFHLCLPSCFNMFNCDLRS